MENAPTEVLVVDDEPAVAIAIKSALKYCGYGATTVSDGMEALAAIKAEPGRFGAVISDHNMPGLAGLGLVKALREAEFPGRVVILSAFLTKDNEAQYQRLGVDQILAKPFNLQRLRLAMAAATPPAACAS